ncbi:MAG: patatin-like phospholipase family protein [Marmoricola sp.]
MTTDAQMTTGLVLGGGGVTGIAWEIGLLKGLRDLGTDLTSADTVIGTSAGSVVGAQVTSRIDLDDLYAEQTSPADAEIGADFGAMTMLKLVALMLLPANPIQRRRRIGRAARAAHPEPATERLRVIGGRLRTPQGDTLSWPDHDLRITAVDADSGRLRVFDRTSGVDLLHAVAASCAVPLVWPAVEIEGRHHVDGGIRSPANADLVKGCKVVLVIAPLPRSVSRYHGLSKQLARTGATRTAVISPDADALKAIGKNVLDPAMRVGAAKAGYAQAQQIAAEVARGWVA